MEKQKQINSVLKQIIGELKGKFIKNHPARTSIYPTRMTMWPETPRMRAIRSIDTPAKVAFHQLYAK